MNNKGRGGGIVQGPFCGSTTKKNIFVYAFPKAILGY